MPIIIRAIHTLGGEGAAWSRCAYSSCTVQSLKVKKRTIRGGVRVGLMRFPSRCTEQLQWKLVHLTDVAQTERLKKSSTLGKLQQQEKKKAEEDGVTTMKDSEGEAEK
ncbi:unnamed protein product [Pleuronectes platessa]|uniref:Uncharacterized protein n=1 Tax=Pleuronectes platessa TaxID=8262 RepID=A0A9N7UUP2_PLEPL|nr:unnamed protein product [Pleuronectes platessa]